MNPIFSKMPGGDRGFPYIVRISIVTAVLFLWATLAPLARAQNPIESDAEFKTAVGQLSQARLQGTDENAAPLEGALTYLDGVVFKLLSNPAGADLTAANQDLAALVSHDPPVGEDYRLMPLGEKSTSYALVVNFGLGGPAAVRIYFGTNGQYGLAGRIDSFTQKDFFDSDIELLMVSPADGVFVIASGRTDDLSTGVFSAWRFDGHVLTSLWSSDPLELSSYESVTDGLQLTYCSKPDDDHPGQCLEMLRDVYGFQGGQWKRIRSTSLGNTSSVNPP